MKREFHRASFSRFKAEEIQLIAEELPKIERAEGEIRISRLVELARSQEHKLHPLIFRLSDGDAAERWRFEEARRVCRAVEVRYVDDEGAVKHVAPLVVSCRVASPGEGEDEAERQFVQRAYRSTELALSDPATRDELLAELARDIERIQIKAKAFSDLAAALGQAANLARRKLRRRKSA
jgi:hypothetical protein